MRSAETPIRAANKRAASPRVPLSQADRSCSAGPGKAGSHERLSAPQLQGDCDLSSTPSGTTSKGMNHIVGTQSLDGAEAARSIKQADLQPRGACRLPLAALRRPRRRGARSGLRGTSSHASPLTWSPPSQPAARDVTPGPIPRRSAITPAHECEIARRDGKREGILQPGRHQLSYMRSRLQKSSAAHLPGSVVIDR